MDKARMFFFMGLATGMFLSMAGLVGRYDAMAGLEWFLLEGKMEQK